MRSGLCWVPTHTYVWTSAHYLPLLIASTPSVIEVQLNHALKAHHSTGAVVFNHASPVPTHQSHQLYAIPLYTAAVHVHNNTDPQLGGPTHLPPCQVSHCMPLALLMGNWVGFLLPTDHPSPQHAKEGYTLYMPFRYYPPFNSFGGWVAVAYLTLSQPVMPTDHFS